MPRRISMTMPFTRRAPVHPVAAAWRTALLTILAALAATGMYAWNVPDASSSFAEDLQDKAASAISPENLRGLAELPSVAAELKSRLDKHPIDPEGWALLARTYSKLRQFAEARRSYEQALAYRPNDVHALVEYADVLAFLNQGRFEGEPQRAIDKALDIDASDPGALQLAGLAAYDRHDFQAAITFWEKLAATFPPDDPRKADVKRALDAVRAKSVPTPPRA